MLTDILAWLREQFMTERSVIRQAPMSFVLATIMLSVLLAAGAYFVLLSVKNDQIAFYREKLGELPAPKARYSLMRNDDLKKSAISFSGHLRDRISIYEKRRADISANDMVEGLNRIHFDNQHPTKEGMEAFQGLLKETMKKEFTAMNESVDEYEREFRPDAIAIRDELQARLPPGITTADPVLYLSAPGGLFGGRQIADDIDRLARMLP